MSSQGYGAMSRWPVDGICDGGWEHVTIYGNTADEYLNHTGLRYASQFGASQAAAWMRG